jgi:hypothetical protein
VFRQFEFELSLVVFRAVAIYDSIAEPVRAACARFNSIDEVNLLGGGASVATSV